MPTINSSRSNFQHLGSGGILLSRVREGHSWTPVNQRWDQVPKWNQRPLASCTCGHSMASAASQAGDAGSTWAPGPTSGLQGFNE